MDDELVANWGTAETELGETTYRLMPEGSMEILDRVQARTARGATSAACR